MIGEAPHTRRAMVGEAAMLQLLLHLPALAANYHRECRLARRFLRTWPANSWISYVKPISFPPHHYQHHGQTKEDILINQPLTIEKNSSCFYKQPQVLGYHGNNQRAPSERHSDDITVDNLQAGWTLDQYALRDNYTQRLGIRFPGECINVRTQIRYSAIAACFDSLKFQHIIMGHKRSCGLEAELESLSNTADSVPSDCRVITLQNVN